MHKTLTTLTILLLLGSEAALAAKVAQVTSVRGTVTSRHGTTRERVRILSELEPSQVLELGPDARLRTLWYSSGVREEVRGPAVVRVTPQGLSLPPGQGTRLTRAPGTPSLKGIGTALYGLRSDQQGASLQRSAAPGASVLLPPQCSDDPTPTLRWHVRGQAAEVFVEVLDASSQRVAAYSGQGSSWRMDCPLAPGDYICCVRALDADGRGLDERSATLRIFSAEQGAERKARRSAFEQQIQTQPDQAEAYLLEAGDCLQQQRLEEAASVLERLAERLPDAPAPHEMLVAIYQRLGDRAAAERHRKKLSPPSSSQPPR